MQKYGEKHCIFWKLNPLVAQTQEIALMNLKVRYRSLPHWEKKMLTLPYEQEKPKKFSKEKSQSYFHIWKLKTHSVSWWYEEFAKSYYNYIYGCVYIHIHIGLSIWLEDKLHRK